MEQVLLLVVEGRLESLPGLVRELLGETRQVLLWLMEERQWSLPELVQEPLQGEAGALTGQ